MTKLILLLLILCNINITAQSLNDLSFGSADNLDVITWNLEWFPKNGQATLDSLTTAITALDADIIAVQEINNTTEFNNLISQLSGYSGYYGGSNLRLGFIYKTSLLIDSITTIFSNNSYNFAGRPPLVLHLSFNNHNFTVINVHFKCCGDGILDLSNSSDEETRRYNAMNMIQQYIDQNHSNDNVIVLGDFNDLLTDISSNNVFQQVINDSTNYTFADMAIANGSSANWSYPTWPSHLDHILITNELTDELNNGTIETILIDNYFSGGFAQYDATISDHRPVGISLGFPIYGCTDSTALNYDPLATVDDSTCIYQMTYVPDDNFEQRLIDLGYDNVLDDSVLTSNIISVDSLFAVYVSDFTGIEDFTSLTTFICYNNQFTSLDISNNSALTFLYCQSQLTSLDVSNNTALTYLGCNNNQLTSLDVSNNTALTSLQCQSNQLTSLDVSGATALTSLQCQSNQLTSLDVSGATALITLDCHNNQLTSLDVSGATALITLDCHNNQLTSLDVRNGNNMNMYNSNFTSHYYLYCIDVDDVAWSDSNWTNIDPWAGFSGNCQLGVQGCTDSTNINYDPSATANDGSCIYAKTYVPDNNFENYLEANSIGDGIALNDSVYTHYIKNATSLNVSSQGIADLTGIEDFTALTTLSCSNNNLPTLDVSNNTALTTLVCEHNYFLTTLNLSGATALTVILCEYNDNLTALDISNNTALYQLECGYNPLLTTLDVSNNTALTRLDCNRSNLSSLDVSGATALIALNCFDNQLTSLDVSNNTALTFLLCHINQLTSLDLRNGNNTNLTNFRSTSNYDLYCINVDDSTWSTNNWTAANWTNIDSWASFSNNCTYPGCTDSLALNYNPLATISDSSCIPYIYGCTDSIACNYSSLAHVNDSSCIYIDNPVVDLTLTSYTLYYNFSGCDSIVIYDTATAYFSNNNYVVIVPQINFFTFPFDTLSWSLCGDKITLFAPGNLSIFFMPNIYFNGIFNSANLGFSGISTADFPYSYPHLNGCWEMYPDQIYGCTDSTACNYDLLATTDDGSCEWTSCSGGICANDPISGLGVTSIIHNRATFTFDDMNTYDAMGVQVCRVDQLRIQYKEVGTSSWSQKNMGSPTGYDHITGICNSTTNTAKLVLGLTSATTYEWRMKVWYCGIGNSGWVNGPNFTTEDLCPNVINFTATPVNTVKVNFTWDTTTAYSFVRIKLRVDTTNASWLSAGGFGVNYPILSKQKSGLTPGATYRAQARTWCSPTGGAYRSLGWTPLIYWTQPTSIKIEGENTAITNLEVYPNPSRDVFNITFTSNEKQDLEIRIINVIGEIIFIESKQQFIGEYTKQIDLKEYPKAIYFLEIETDDGVINKKLILQ